MEVFVPKKVTPGAVYFFDSSALVKRYALETGSEWVMATTEPQTGHTLYIARITAVEVISAITRRRRGGSLSETDAATASSDFRYDLSHQYRVVEVTATVISQAMELADKHALRRKAFYKELRQHLGDVLSNSSLTKPIPINGCPIAPCEVANPSGSSKNSMACSLPITRSDY